MDFNIQREESFLELVYLFIGIGYFTLPYLVHAKAKKLIACEWNPHAAEALKNNLKLNKVAERCEVLEGDNRLVNYQLFIGESYLFEFQNILTMWKSKNIRISGHSTNQIIH